MILALVTLGAIAAKVNYLRQNHAISVAVSPNRKFSEVTADGASNYRKISAYGIMIGVHGRGTARLFDRPLIEAV
jgi:hypothetical protein